MTATVVPRASTAAAWAAPSMPTASPDTTRRPDLDEARGDPRRRRPDPALVARRVPTIATAASALHRRRIAEDVQQVRRHLDRAQPRRIGRILDRDHARGRAPGCGRASRARRSAASAIASATVRRQAVAAACRCVRPRPARPRPSGPGHRASRPRAGSRRRCRSARAGRPNPTGPSPRTPARTAHASRSASVGAGAVSVHDVARCSTSVPTVRLAHRSGDPTPSISVRLDSRQPHVGRAVPGGLIEVLSRSRTCEPARSAIVRATRRIRSVPRPLARSSSASSTMRRSAARPRRQASRSARPVSRPFRTPVGRPSATSTSGRDPRRDGRRAFRVEPRTSGCGATRGIVIQRSIRSRSGPETVAGSARARAAGRCTRDPTSRRSRTGTGSSPRPAGSGPGTSSPGRPARSRRVPPRAAARSASRTSRSNSGSSSRNSTPWSARVTSPGDRCGPPPTIAAYDIV